MKGCKYCGGEIYQEGFGDGEVLRRCSDCDEIAQTQDTYSRMTRAHIRQDEIVLPANRDMDRRKTRRSTK